MKASYEVILRGKIFGQRTYTCQDKIIAMARIASLLVKHPNAEITRELIFDHGQKIKRYVVLFGEE